MMSEQLQTESNGVPVQCTGCVYCSNLSPLCNNPLYRARSAESVLNVAVYKGDNVCVHHFARFDSVYTRLLRTLSVCVLSIAYVFYYIIKITSFHRLKVKQGNTSFKTFKGGLPLITKKNSEMFEILSSGFLVLSLQIMSKTILYWKFEKIWYMNIL